MVDISKIAITIPSPPRPLERFISPGALRMPFQSLGDVIEAYLGILRQVSHPQKRRLVDRVLRQSRLEGDPRLVVIPRAYRCKTSSQTLGNRRNRHCDISPECHNQALK